MLHIGAPARIQSVLMPFPGLDKKYLALPLTILATKHTI
uniref:Uncharacterized protein n=1 Tax=Rhizophora mucronata TaxID=61149 RepID=A0A2P2PA60_RHIMU